MIVNHRVHFLHGWEAGSTQKNLKLFSAVAACFHLQRNCRLQAILCLLLEVGVFRLLRRGQALALLKGSCSVLFG
ncbi:hypothetical protein K7X08_020689 [Anisodus acutangulus]|uniref:Uncharacterized protein n=1 Tax=Anisodus acutangulus TaxID=402998 RepID=A0A9Q1MT18_9SOLA|nr:hypothetical protein K7X08_020689 [Anisodus acutangulus]